MKSSELSLQDYNPFYKRYIDTLGDTELLGLMRSQLVNYPQFIASIPPARWQYSYGLGKWTVAEVLLHVIDSERVFQYRALRIGRKDETPMPGFDQDSYVPNSGGNKRSKESIISEYKSVRGASISLYETFSEEDLQLQGTANNSLVTVGALGFIMCGHQKHHRNMIREHYLITQS